MTDDQTQPVSTHGTLVAAGMVGMNVAIYVFNIVAARRLLPEDFGALTAMFSVILVGNVAALGLQAAIARRIAVEPEHRVELVDAVVHVATLVSIGVGAIVALTSIVLTPALKLASPWPVILCGATLVPLTIMGAQSGVAQGTQRWKMLSAIYAGNGLGRMIGGTGALLIEPSVTSAMIGMAMGSWAPVLVGWRMLERKPSVSSKGRRRPLLREAQLSTHALLAYFVLSNMDALIARNSFDERDSGLYASGLILAKAALFFPQFVSVVVFPDLARATTAAAKLRAVALVGGFGVLAVTITAIASPIALIVVGGHRYGEIESRLWLFALVGSMLAIVHLLVFDALARHAHGVTPLLWAGVTAVIAIAYGFDVHITGLVLTITAVAAALIVAFLVVPSLRQPRSVSGFVPGAPGAHGDVEGH
ncbi:MAG: oligosaccharide flippase family protein [Aeromicrobium sp.]